MYSLRSYAWYFLLDTFKRFFKSDLYDTLYCTFCLDLSYLFCSGNCPYDLDLVNKLVVMLQNVLWSCGTIRISCSRRTPWKVLKVMLYVRIFLPCAHGYNQFWLLRWVSLCLVICLYNSGSWSSFGFYDVALQFMYLLITYFVCLTNSNSPFLLQISKILVKEFATNPKVQIWDGEGKLVVIFLDLGRGNSYMSRYWRSGDWLVWWYFIY